MGNDIADKLAAVEHYINEQLVNDKSARLWPLEHAPSALASVYEQKPWAEGRLVFLTPPGFPSSSRDLPPAGWALKNGWGIGIL